MAETTLTPSRVWKQMTLDERRRVARAFWDDPEATDDHVQAALLIAQQKKFRAKTVINLDPDRKARHLATMVTLPDAVVARTLVVYHMAEQRAMMGAFLDALGIAHEEGLIQEDAVTPDPAKLNPAVMSISGQFPAADVRIYLMTLLCQDGETWGGLGPILEGLRADGA
jgi:hypothetical protein